MFIKSILVLLLLSCTSLDGDGDNSKAGPEALYKDAKRLFDKKSYQVAQEKIRKIREKFPYSYYANPAELLNADILFQQSNYLEAATAYHVFRELHPKDKNLDYVIFKIGESYHKMMPSTPDKDISITKRAIRSYEELLAKFPNAIYKKSALKHLKEARGMILNHEKGIADFYFKTKNYEAARYRFLDIANTFKEKEISNYSKLKVVESSYLMEDYPLCLGYIKMFAAGLNEEAAKKADDYVTKCSEKLKNKS